MQVNLIQNSMGQNVTNRRRELHQQRERKFVKIVIAGGLQVGKSSLCSRLVDNTFSTAHITTLGAAFSTKQVQSRNEETILQIWDTAGNPKYRPILGLYTRETQYLILVYDITSMLSFKELSQFMNLQQLESKSILKKVLVGNKCDQQEKREVSIEQGQKLANEHNFEFIQTSCKDSVNVQKLFTMFLEDIRQEKRKIQDLKRDATRTRYQQPANLRQGCWS